MSADHLHRIPAPVIPGISDSVRVSGGDLLFVSGAVGFEPDGSLPEDFARAVELTLREVERALEAGGTSLSNLVRINVYITDLDQERFMTFRRVRDEILEPDEKPASTLVGVASLLGGAAIEIDAIATV